MSRAIAALEYLATRWESLQPPDRPHVPYTHLARERSAAERLGDASGDRCFMFSLPRREEPVLMNGASSSLLEYTCQARIGLATAGESDWDRASRATTEANHLCREIERRGVWPSGVATVRAEVGEPEETEEGDVVIVLGLRIACWESSAPRLDYLNGFSLRFDAQNDFVYVPDHADLRLTETQTLSLWFRLDAAVPNRTLASRWSYATDGGWAIQTGLNDAQARRLVLYLANASNANVGSCRIDTGNVWTPGQWHHLVWTFAAGVITIYIDGQSVAWTLTQGSIPSALLPSGAELRFGAWSGTLDRYFGPGNIDDAALIRPALGAAAVQSLAASGRPANIAELPVWSETVGWWRMGDGDSYPTIFDRRGGEGAATVPHHATMANMGASSIVAEVP